MRRNMTGSICALVALTTSALYGPMVAQAATSSGNSSSSQSSIGQVTTQPLGASSTGSPMTNAMSGMGFISGLSPLPSNPNPANTSSPLNIKQVQVSSAPKQPSGLAGAFAGILYGDTTSVPLNTISIAAGTNGSNTIINGNQVWSGVSELSMGSSTQSVTQNFAPSNPQYTTGQMTEGTIISGLNSGIEQKLQQILNDPGYKLSNSDKSFLSSLSGQASQNVGTTVNAIVIIETRVYTATGYKDTLEIGATSTIKKNSGNAKIWWLSKPTIISKNVVLATPPSTPPSSVAPVNPSPAPAQNQPVPVHLADGTTMGSNQQYQSDVSGGNQSDVAQTTTDH